MAIAVLKALRGHGVRCCVDGDGAAPTGAAPTDLISCSVGAGAGAAQVCPYFEEASAQLPRARDADGDSSDFTFCKVDYAETDGQLEIPVASMTLEDDGGYGANISKTKKIQDETQIDNSITDGSSGSISSSINSTSLNIKEPVVPESTRESVQSNVLAQPKPSKKPTVRAKVPFEKGYSPMDWLKLTRTHPDLAGLKGQTNRRLISLEEVKQHKTGDCIWTVLKGRVYNIGPYMKFHPGGVDMLRKAAGKDCTALFNKYHAWVNAEFLLEKCLVGFLEPSE